MELNQSRGQHDEQFHMSSYFNRCVLGLIDTDAHGFQFLDGEWKSVGDEAAGLHAYVDTNV